MFYYCFLPIVTVSSINNLDGVVQSYNTLSLCAAEQVWKVTDPLISVYLIRLKTLHISFSTNYIYIHMLTVYVNVKAFSFLIEKLK